MNEDCETCLINFCRRGLAKMPVGRGTPKMKQVPKRVAPEPWSLLTSDCVASGNAGGVNPVRVHALLGGPNVLAEFDGSWLHAALRDGLMDCSGGMQTTNDDRRVWLVRPYDPLRDATNASEMYFILTTIRNVFRRGGVVPAQGEILKM